MRGSKISMRCGKDSCESYDKHNKISGCHKFDDRRNCGISMEQRRKVRYTSRKKSRDNWF